MTEAQFIFVPKESSKDAKKRQAMEEKGGYEATEEEREIRASKSGASIIVPKLKNYTAKRTLELILDASKKNENEGKREASYKQIHAKYDLGEATVNGYIKAATEGEGGGILIPLSMAEEREFKKNNDLKGKRGKSYLFYCAKSDQ